MASLILKRHALSLLVAILISVLYGGLFLISPADFPWLPDREFSQEQGIIIASLLLGPSLLMLVLYRLGDVVQQQYIFIQILINTITTVFLTTLIIKVLRLVSAMISVPTAEYLVYAILVYLTFCIFFLWYQCFLLILNSNNKQVITLLITGFYFLLGGFSMTFAIELCYLFLT